MKWIKDLSIKNKILIGVGGTFLIVMLVLGLIINNQFDSLQDRNNSNLRKVLLEKEKERIQNAVHSMAQSLGEVYQRNQSQLSQEELRQLIVEHNKDVRFGEAGYFFIYKYKGDNQGETISLPPDPDLEGTNRWGLQDSNGKYIIRSFAEALENDKHFVEYVYANPNTGEKEVKFGYVEQIPGTEWLVGSGSYESVINSTLNSAKGRINKVKRNTLMIILGVFVVGTVIVALVIFMVSKYITNGIDKILTSVQDFAQRNLNTQVNLEREDELGDLARGFNQAIKDQREILEKILNTTEDLSAYSQQLSASAQEGNAAIDTTTANVEDMIQGINQISRSSQELADLAQQTYEKTDKGQKLINKTIAKMNEVDTSVEEAKGTIDNLDDTSQEIGEIVDMINEIAEQTNLLALNASIEAARAGEAGEGFAVVADEIKDLADETAQATEKANHLIQETQQQSQKGRQEIGAVVEKTDEGTELIEETGEAFSGIADLIEDTSASTEETSASAEELAANSDQVSTATDDLDSMSAEISNSAQELAQLAQELQQLVEEYNL
ncbi:methyl-accepting chemotaxis protein [Halanaerobacter jeridensis]|uniref:Methyl-accepting chemotaxis protein n=1 Tax=Halanaerobacter jeridensis TaxID=706427 RepID=A0A938XS58_9FIRM|nr:methyl-accepting chemotaxis protein [Halanaerobacter jeridensis]